MGQCEGELKVKERKHVQVMTRREREKRKNELPMAKEVIVSHRDTSK